jgi:hypothetical protein
MMFLLIVTLTSMLLAAIMSVIAWRIAGDERRRSEARVAVLSAEIHDAVPAPVAIFAQAGAARCAVNANLFVAQQAPSGSRPFAVLAGGALVFGAAIAMAILLGGRFSRAPRSANPVAVAAPAALPLELVALGHERVGDRLTVRGVVRNPASGAGMDRLTAVVFLFTSNGGFLASGRAAVESPALRPGGESTFVVTVPGASDVGRYRVSFRTDDRLVSHVDRRHES